jgi:hypothetical protein
MTNLRCDSVSHRGNEAVYFLVVADACLVPSSTSVAAVAWPSSGSCGAAVITVQTRD